MNQAVVGNDVGFHVRYRGVPDSHWPSGIKRLERVCRECRVFQEEETARDFRLVDFDTVPTVGDFVQTPSTCSCSWT